MQLEIHVGTGDMPGRMNWIREHFPYGGNDHILSIDFWQGVVHIHLEEKPDYEQSAWLLHQREVDEIITSFDFTSNAPQAETQLTPIGDVLFNSYSRRVVLIDHDYEFDVRDLVLELDEQGYTTNLVYRNANGTARIPMTAANAKKIAQELERWEKEHGDAHPF